MQIESTNIGTYRVRYARQKPPAQQTQDVKKTDQSSPFAALLKQKINADDSLKFSTHAQKRLNSRDINLSDNDMTKLTDAVDKAASKGARESLVLLKNLAFIVNIPHRTVVTAIDEGSMKENIFTNIDSAVLA